MSDSDSRRVVITGVGVVTPLGNDADGLVMALRQGDSGIRPLRSVPTGVLSIDHAAEAIGFTGHIDDYGPLEKALKRTIRKGSKVMCREIEMGVAVAQRALTDAGLDLSTRDRSRVGVIYGCDYIMSLPEEFAGAVAKCLDEDGKFRFEQWGSRGKPEINPLWLLKYLPNMPASHIAIYNDLRGPNNSITIREASAGAAVSEAYSTLVRGHAEVMVVGSTGSKVHTLRSLHASMQEDLATDDPGDPAGMSRPFDQKRSGAVLGEGAGALVCETLASANQRGATILGEIIGYASSAVGPAADPRFLRTSIANVLRGALRQGNADPRSIGHVHAHGLATTNSDRDEAAAIADVFGDPDDQPPVTTIKGHVGNLGAGGGMVEIIASLKSLGGELFPIRNLESLDADCPINAVADRGVPAGDSFVSVNITPQGQSTAVRLERYR